jgi:hypothetical protein
MRACWLVLGAVVLAGCGGQGLGPLKAAVASGDEKAVLAELSKLPDDLEGVDQRGLEELLLEVRTSKDMRIQEYSYNFARDFAMPRFAALYEDMRASQKPEDLAVLASFPLVAEDSLAALRAGDDATKAIALRGAYRLSESEVEPVVREGLKSGIAEVRTHAVSLAGDFRLVGLAEQVVALLGELDAGERNWARDEQIVRFVRGNALSDYYDEIEPVEKELEKRPRTEPPM